MTISDSDFSSFFCLWDFFMSSRKRYKIKIRWTYVRTEVCLQFFPFCIHPAAMAAPFCIKSNQSSFLCLNSLIKNIYRIHNFDFSLREIAYKKKSQNLSKNAK